MEATPRGPLEPNPLLLTDELTGADISEPLARLAGSEIDELLVDGYRLVYVQAASHDRRDGVTTVVCEDDSGGEHTFVYRPDSGSLVFRIGPDTDSA